VQTIRIPALRTQALIGIGFMGIALLAAWQIGGKIAIGDTAFLIYAALGFAACAATVVIMQNWRTGFYIFFVWMMFEDLVRKYMGNGLALFFGKDVLLALIYLSFYAAVRKGREKTFRPPFLFFFSLFFWLGLLQVFNPNSPSIWYGLLGFKVYFYYVPLLFVGYSLIRNDEDLKKFLTVNALLAIAVSVIGITQSIRGNGFLNPASLAPELQELGDLNKTTLSGQFFNLPDSVFVSAGRYTEYLPIAFLIAMGAAGYLLLYTKRSRGLVFTAIGLLGVAALLSGNRGCFGTILIASVLLSMGFVWGAPWRQRQAHRMVKAIRQSALIAATALIIVFALFPQEAGSRLQYYTETMLPNGGNYQLGYRAWDYPLQNFLAAFSLPNWVFGYGIGTASLGTQYVAKLTGTRPLPIGVEEGYGALIVQMGIVAPVLWILWTAALLYYSWKVIRTLRETRLFPIALAIGWYAFVLLYQWTYGSMNGYENYTCNVFLWLLIGILFRLPDLLVKSPNRDSLVLADSQASGLSS